MMSEVEEQVTYEVEVGPEEVQVQADPKVAALEAELNALKAGLSGNQNQGVSGMQEQLMRAAAAQEQLAQMQRSQAEAQKPQTKNWNDVKEEFGQIWLERPKDAIEMVRTHMLANEVAPVLAQYQARLEQLESRQVEGDVKQDPIKNFVLERHKDEVMKRAKEIGGPKALDTASQELAMKHVSEYAEYLVEQKMSGQAEVKNKPALSPVGGNATGGGSGSGGKVTVRMTPEQVEDARVRGISNEQYVKWVLKK
jgi:hypothetical protein